MALENPLQIIYRHPLMPLATSLAKGAIWTILCCFCENKCHPMSDDDCRNVAGIPTCDWRRHQKRILETVRAIMPALQVWYETGEKKRLGRKHIALLGGAANAARLKRMANQAAKDKASLRDEGTREGIVPVPPPHVFYNQDKHDHHAHVKASASNKAKPKDGKLLKDK